MGMCQLMSTNSRTPIHIQTHNMYDTHTHTQEDRFQWMEAILPGSSANLRAFSERNSLRVAEREHYQQEYRRIQPSPPPSYPPPQLLDADQPPRSPRSPRHAPQQTPPSFTMPPAVRPPKDFDASASWHGRPNVYRNPNSGRNNSLPSPDEQPQPYLQPELLSSVQERCSINNQRGGVTLAPAPVPYDSRSIPRNFERQGNQFAHTNGGPPLPSNDQHRPQPHQRRHGASFTKSSTAQDVMTNPPPKPPRRSITDTEINSPALDLDENDDPYQMMLSSPVRRVNREAVDSSHSAKPKPKPRSRKVHSPNSSPTVNPASPPVQKQSTISNQYVELCGDSGARIEEDGTPTDSTATDASTVDVVSSLNQLVTRGIKQSDSSESGSGVIPEDLQQSFTSSQLQLLINMLQKVQAAQESNGEEAGGGGGEGEGEGGGRGDVAATIGGRVGSPTSPHVQGPLYEVEDVQDRITLKGNFSKLIHIFSNVPKPEWHSVAYIYMKDLWCSSIVWLLST